MYQIEHVLKGHTDRVRSAVFSPKGGQYVLSASNDATAKIWEVATGKCLFTLEGHTQAVLSAAFSPDGDLVVTASEDNTARLWDAKTGEPFMVFEEEASQPDGDSEGGEDAQPGLAELTVRQVSLLSDGQLGAVLDGQAAAIAQDINAAEGEDAARDAERGNADDPRGDADGKQPKKSKPLVLEGHTAAVTSVAFAPNGQRVVTGSADSTAKVWDASTGNEILTLAGHSEEVTTVSFSPAGKSILTGSRDGTCILWLALDWRPEGPENEIAKPAPAMALNRAAK
jgi:WD40 repeat protein